MEYPSHLRQLYTCCHKPPEAAVPGSFSFAEFTALLEAHRSRQLHFVPMPDGAKWATAWIAGPDDDWIVYREPEQPGRDVQLALHQVAHMVLGHRGIAVSGPTLASLLFPGLDALLARCLPSDTDPVCGVASGNDEREAIALAEDLAHHGGNLVTTRSAA